jgi:hypothetical protein
MDEHVHTGFVVFVTTGVYAVLFIWGVRLIAAKMVDYAPTATLGKSLGAVVHFGS